MVTSNDPTLVVSSKPCQSAQTSKTSEHIYIYLLKTGFQRFDWFIGYGILAIIPYPRNSVH